MGSLSQQSFRIVLLVPRPPLWKSLFSCVGVFCQLGPPYFGHLLFEKTHRSIDQSPIFAAMGSWYTTLQIFLGRQSVTYGPRERENQKSKEKEGSDTDSSSMKPSEEDAVHIGQLPLAAARLQVEKDEAR